MWAIHSTRRLVLALVLPAWFGISPMSAWGHDDQLCPPPDGVPQCSESAPPCYTVIEEDGHYHCPVTPGSGPSVPVEPTSSWTANAPMLPPASDPMGRQGFVRIINHSRQAGRVEFTAIDDAGQRRGPITLSIGANASVHFNAKDLEQGNPAKGLPDGIGPGEGNWRLQAEGASINAEAIGYVRHTDGFLTTMGSLTPRRDAAHYVATFNPASNQRQRSLLRLVNVGRSANAAEIAGLDDEGRSPGGAVKMSIPGKAAMLLDSVALETGEAHGLERRMGDGVGKWRLSVRAHRDVTAMSLLESPSGHLTNLSTMPAHRHEGALILPLLLSSSDPMMRQGFVRIINHSDRAGAVRIKAFDDSGRDYEPLTLSIGANAAVHFNSHDLELGNVEKGLEGSTGPASEGHWRLTLQSGLDIQALAYVRHPDGFLTSMHDVAPERGGTHRVATFNPASNDRQRSMLRVVNLGTEAAGVTVRGIDSAGQSPGTDVSLEIPAGRSATLSAADLESGGKGLEGALGDGSVKWRLLVSSEQPILVMSLMESPSGQLTNLSWRSLPTN